MVEGVGEGVGGGDGAGVAMEGAATDEPPPCGVLLTPPPDWASRVVALVLCARLIPVAASPLRVLGAVPDARCVA